MDEYSVSFDQLTLFDVNQYREIDCWICGGSRKLHYEQWGPESYQRFFVHDDDRMACNFQPKKLRTWYGRKYDNPRWTPGWRPDVSKYLSSTPSR